MKRISLLAVTFAMAILAQKALAQEKEKILAEAAVKNIFEKKIRVGISWNQYWGIIKGTNLPETYFGKPCIGFNIRAEYYPLSFIGIGAGFGVQQRGAGIKNIDNYGAPFTHPWLPNYDPDSTYRERLRMNTLELPITLLLRIPKEFIKGVRFSGAAGVVIIKNDYVKDFFNKPEDGFHVVTDVSDNFIKNDLAYQMSLGTDIDAGGSSIFQFHLVYSRGTKNVYKVGPGNGKTETYGFRVAWLF